VATFTWNAGTIQNRAGTNLNIKALIETLTLNLAGAGTHSFNADANQIIAAESTSVLSGTGALTKDGLGMLTLAGANSYSGGTAVSAGTLQAAKAGALPGYGTANKVTVANAATLAVNYGGASDWSSTEVGNLLTSNAAGFASGSIMGFDTTNGSGAYGTNITVTNLGLTKTGTNTLTLTGTNTYTGTTTVSNGKLLVNNTSGSGTGSGAVTVASGATLGGTGSLTGAVTVTGGTLSPGASVESFSTGAVTLAGGTFEYETNHSALPAAAGDLLIANGNLTLSGTVNLTLTDLALPTGAFTPNSTTLTLIQYAGTWNGGFFTYNTNELTNNESFEDTYGNNWKITYNATSGGSNFATELLGGGQFVTLSNLTAVPEPGSLFALGCLIGSGALLRSRRRAA
jgi:autotransporter-associated beta strand protein